MEGILARDERACIGIPFTCRGWAKLERGRGHDGNRCDRKSVRMRAFREVLSEGKRPTYDMNRAHVSARYRKARR